MGSRVRGSRGVPAGLSGVAGGASGKSRVSGDRAMGAGRSDPAGVEIDLRQSGRGFRPAACLETGVSPVLMMAWVRRTRCRCGRSIAGISAISTRGRRIVGGASIRRSPACSPAFIAAVLISDPDFCLLNAVAERSVGRRRRGASRGGGIGSANADMSSVNEGEKPSRRKSKGSCARSFRAGLAGPLRRGRKP